MKPVRVLIIDDSKLMRMLLTKALNRASGIEVVGEAADAFEARDQIKNLNPDVLTLDLSMPRMNGLQFLENIMRLRPMPVVIVSSMTEQHSDMALQALALGAVDLVNKPASAADTGRVAFPEELAQKVLSAAAARVKVLAGRVVPAPMTQPKAPRVEEKSRPARAKSSGVATQERPADRIIAIGSSTGGTEAVRVILEELKPTRAGIVITQHIPPEFSGPFARRLDDHSSLVVCEAADGDRILSGHAYVAPGNRHLKIVRDGQHYCCRLSDEPPVGHHKPAVNVLFGTVAQVAGANAIGVILTGMGRDGATGLKSMRDAGARTISQDEESCVVWGMPKAAVKEGAVDQVLALHDVAAELNRLTLNDVRARKKIPSAIPRPEAGTEDRILDLEKKILELQKAQASSCVQPPELDQRNVSGSN